MMGVPVPKVFVALAVLAATAFASACQTSSNEVVSADDAPAQMSTREREGAYEAWRRTHGDEQRRLRRAAAETRAAWADVLDRLDVSASLAEPIVLRVRDTGVHFWECALCPEMILAPAGAFTIGSPDNESGRADDEGPRRTVRIEHAIAVSRFEITRGEYRAFVEATGRTVGAPCITDRRERGNWAPDAQTSFQDPGFEQEDSHPADCVSWNDAMAYVAWLNSQTSGGYRLLTEAEWEYLARAGSTSAYPWGDSVDEGCAFANVTDARTRAHYAETPNVQADQMAECDDGFLRTSPVGAHRPNAFGIHGMIGNVGEWTADCVTPNYERMRSDGESAGADCTRRMVRGGSWGTYARQVRSAERIRYAPGTFDDSIGIRVAKTVM